MNTHNFPADVKVQRFCLMLMGEARLWYDSLEPIVMTWQELQNQFGNSIQNKEILENSYFMHGGHFIMMRMQRCQIHV